MADDDFELLAAWCRGDRDAGRALTHRHFASLRRFFLNKVDAQSVEDLVQDTLLACVAAAATARRAASFRAYLFTIARNTLYRRLRRASGDRPIEGDVETLAELASTPSSLLARRHEERVLLEALRSVPLDQQIVLELYYWEELSTAEIADIVQMPRSTVTTRLARARDRLRERFDALSRTPDGLATTVDDIELWARRVRGAL